MKKHPVEEIAETVGGTIEEAGRLPDGSGFATMSMPLPKDHWLYADHELEMGPRGYEAPPMLLRIGTDHLGHNQVKRAIWAAVKYALRVSTANGTQDYDPDAVCQNVVVGLIGYHTFDGLAGSDDWANPKPIPPRFVVPKEWAEFHDQNPA